MADFCRQCSLDTFQEDFRELANLLPPEKYNAAEGIGAGGLCEGCGFVAVDIDGNCISLDCEVHGEENTRKWNEDHGSGI